MSVERTAIDMVEVRISFIKLGFEAGMRSSDNSGDWSPWFTGGLAALEKGEEVTPELIQKLDVAQTMVFPPADSSPQRG